MQTRTKILALLSLPAGVIGYLVTGALLSGLPLETGIGDAIQLFVPLLVAALCMAPFLIPFFDQLAKRDLAALEELRAAGRDEAPSRDDAD